MLGNTLTSLADRIVPRSAQTRLPITSQQENVIVVGGANTIEGQSSDSIKVKLDRTTKIFYDPPDMAKHVNRQQTGYGREGAISPIQSEGSHASRDDG